MNYLKFIMCLVACLLPMIVQSYDIEFSRSYNKVMTENNQLIVKLNTNGTGYVDFPDFYRLNQRVEINDKSNKLVSAESLVGVIKANKIQSSLKTKMAAIKKYHNLPLFYSSDVDVFRLKIADGDAVVLDVSFNNWEELNHRYQFMGKWQPMIDLIKVIQQVGIDAQTQLKMEAEQ